MTIGFLLGPSRREPSTSLSEDVGTFVDILQITVKHTFVLICMVHTHILNQLPTSDYHFGFPDIVMRRILKHKRNPPNFQG